MGTLLAAIRVALLPLPAARYSLMIAGLALAIATSAWPSLNRLLPERAAQVSNQTIFRASRTQTAFRWGFELGLAVRTFVVTATVYVLLGLAIAQGDPLAPVLVLGTYGAVRGLTIVLFALLHREGEGPLSGGQLRRTVAPVALATAVLASVGTVL